MITAFAFVWFVISGKTVGGSEFWNAMMLAFMVDTILMLWLTITHNVFLGNQTKHKIDILHAFKELKQSKEDK